MTDEDYQEFDDAALTRFRRRLLRTKGGQEQQDFLRAVRNDEDFLREFRNSVTIQGSRKPTLCHERLTESEFKQPPTNTEADLYGAWSSLPPRIACRTTFWANVTFRHIEAGRIRSSFLAANGGPSATGAERIDRVLQEEEETASNSIDRCVRTVLRRLGGLPEARGNRSVYVDCPFARAWWRERLVSEVSDADPDRAAKVREVTRVNQTYWEELVVLVVSRNSVLGSRAIRDTFILSLADLFDLAPTTPLRKHKYLRAACRMVGAIQASRELSVLDQGELRRLMNDLVLLQHEYWNAGETDS